MKRGSTHLLGIVLIAFVLIGLVLFNVLRDRTAQSFSAPPDLIGSVEVLQRVAQQVLVSSFQQAVVSEKDIREQFIVEVGKREVGLESTNVYGLVRSRAFSITPVSEGWELRMTGIFVVGSDGVSSVKRTFNATIVVDGSGNVVRNIYK